MSFVSSQILWWVLEIINNCFYGCNNFKTPTNSFVLCTPVWPSRSHGNTFSAQRIILRFAKYHLKPVFPPSFTNTDVVPPTFNNLHRNGKSKAKAIILTTHPGSSRVALTDSRREGTQPARTSPLPVEQAGNHEMRKRKKVWGSESMEL